MKELMILLSVLISYPIFMAFSYIVARQMFPSLDKVEAIQQQEKLALIMKARRLKRKARRRHVEPEKQMEPRLIHV
jgi:sensor domain CHASE-containing protein